MARNVLYTQSVCVGVSREYHTNMCVFMGVRLVFIKISTIFLKMKFILVY